MSNLKDKDPSGSLVRQLSVQTRTTGSLCGLRFTVKDNIDIAGHKTSFGNLDWQKHSQTPVYNAVCVDQLLAAGGRCVGKAVCDDLTYSLEGENEFFGTPLNARAPGRIPGGSSSGSASSVANGLAEFSLGTDSGGSVRVPASFCGVWGMRPSMHRISEAGVLPFTPSVSTVGVLAVQLRHLNAAMRVLLRSDPHTVRPATSIQRFFVLTDAMELCDEPIKEAANSALNAIAARLGIQLEPVSFAQLIGQDLSLQDCQTKALRNLQSVEFQNSVGNWMENTKPETSKNFAQAYGNFRDFDRSAAIDSFALGERIFEAIRGSLSIGTLVAFPTTPFIAPLKGSLDSSEKRVDFYDRAMAITAFSGIARQPEISAPLLSVEGCPAGLSFATGVYQDEFLLSALSSIMDGWGDHSS